MSPNVPKCHPLDGSDRAVLSCAGNMEKRRMVDNAVASSLSDAFGMTDRASAWLPRPLGEGNALQRVGEGCPIPRSPLIVARAWHILRAAERMRGGRHHGRG